MIPCKHIFGEVNETPIVDMVFTVIMFIDGRTSGEVNETHILK